VFALSVFLCTHDVRGQNVVDQVILADPPSVDALFGSSTAEVGMVNDENILVSGAPRTTDGAIIPGKAYLINQGDGSIRATLESSNPTNGGRFGAAVASVGDLTGDGFPDVVVGAPREDFSNARSESGYAYVYNGDTGALLYTLQTQTSDLQTGRLFGQSVAGIGDVTGDGVPDIAVAAPEQDGSNAGRAGRVYLFSGADASVVSTISGADNLDGRFGFSLAGGADLIGDPTPDFVVGAPGEDTMKGGSTFEGAGQVYVIDGDTKSKTVLASANPETSGKFGSSVAILGTNYIGVGAETENGGNPDAGRSYLFSVNALSDPPTVLESGNPTSQGVFGSAASSIEDINGNGTADFLVGAPGESVAGNAEAGRAYIFESSSGKRLAVLSTSNPGDAGRFGESVAGGSQLVVGAPREDGGGIGKAGRVYTFTPGINLVDGRDGAPYTAPAPSPGTDANPVGRFRISAGAVGPSLTEVNINNNAPDPSGIDAVELWRSDDATFDASTDTEIASTSYGSSITFSGLDAPLSFNDPSDPDAGTYFFVVADLAATVAGDYDPFILDETNVSFDGGVLFSVNGTETSTFTDAFLSDASTPLPVELASFDANVTDDRTVQLQWQTASETGNSGFRVQRSDDGSSWTTLGRVEGAGTTDEPRSYRFTDANAPYAADSLQYRLAQVDVDGTVNFSDPVTVRFGNPNGLELLGSFPNPARSQATVRFAIPEQMSADNVRLELYDLLGRQVKTIPAAETSGRVEQTLDVSDLPSGTYLLRLSAGGQTQTQQVTIVR
jgi:hypothetical protein